MVIPEICEKYGIGATKVMHKELIGLKREVIRFVIISVLPEPVCSEIRALSEELCNMSGSKTALSYPPHITIRTGALVPFQKVDGYIEGFKSHVYGFVSKKIEKDLLKTDRLVFTEYHDKGERKNMIAYFMRKSPWLKVLNKTLDQYRDFKKTPKKEFIPHISLAYDDLDDKKLSELKRYIGSKMDKFGKRFSFYLPKVSLYYKSDEGI